MLHQASYQGQPCQLLYQRWFHKTYKLCQRLFKFNDFWYLRKFPHYLSLSISALASLKPQAAPGIVPGAAMPAALSKMISQNLQALSKMISIQWLLIFKNVSHYLSLSITALASLKPQAAPGIVPGAAMPAAAAIQPSAVPEPMEAAEAGPMGMTEDIIQKVLILSFT